MSPGIILEAEGPRPNKTGTVLVVRWREPWMREQRQKASQATLTSQTIIEDPMSQSRTTIPEPLPEWPHWEGATMDLRARISHAKPLVYFGASWNPLRDMFILENSAMFLLLTSCFVWEHINISGT